MAAFFWSSILSNWFRQVWGERTARSLPLRRFLLEQLEDRLAPAVLGQLRMVTYNVLGIPDSSALTTVLGAINDSNRAGLTRDIDILLVQELGSGTGDANTIRNILNSLPGSSGQYVAGPSSGGSLQQGVIYNDATIDFVGSQIITGGTGPRDPIRYLFRPQSLDSTYDFYIYNSHYDAVDAGDRTTEAQAIRANADALGQGAEILYAGDYNIDSSFETSYQVLLGNGNGQAFDPINTPGTWHINNSLKSTHTQAPGPQYISGGMDDRFDFILHTQEVGASGTAGDGTGLEYRGGSYWAFGNNGTHPLDGDISQGSGASGTVLAALENASDHLPVVVDYDIVSTDSTPPTLNSFVRLTPATTPTNADSLVFRATFSEPVQNVDSSDFSVAGTTTATITGVAGSGSTRDITIAGGNLVGFNGVVGLDLAGGQNITDLANNPLPAGEPGIDEVYTVDNTLPTLTVTDNVSGGPIAHNTPVTFTLTFSESVTGLEIGDFSNGATTDPAAGAFGNLQGAGANYTVVWTPGGTAGGNLRLQVNNAGVVIQDTATNSLATPAQDDTTIVVNPAITTFGIASTTVLDGGTGFLVTFNAAYDITALNLYTGDIGATLDGRDVQITGPSGNFGIDANDEIRFNAVPINATQLALLQSGPSSVAAAGVLPAGNYTLLLECGTGNSAFRRLSDGAFLDGDLNGTVAADDDYTTSGLTVSAVAANAAVFSIADVIVGPGQLVDVPLVVSNDVNDTRSVGLTIASNPANLEIIGFTVNPAIPGVTSNFTPATGVLTVTSTSVFSGTDNPFLVGHFQVRVPGLGNPGTAPPLGTKSFLDITVTSVTDGASQPKPFLGDDGFHLVGYIGDVSLATGAYSGGDVSAIQSLVIGSSSAFGLYQNLDPRVAADVNKDGNLTGADVSQLQSRIIGGASSIPALPAGSTGVGTGGLDPYTYIDATGITLVPGRQDVLIPIKIQNTDTTEISVVAADYVIEFDPTIFSDVNLDVQVLPGALADGSLQRPTADGGGNASPFAIAFNVTEGVTSAALRTLRITGSAAVGTGPKLEVDQTEVVYFLSLHVKPGAPLGDTILNILDEAEGTFLANNATDTLILIPSPSNSVEATGEQPIDAVIPVEAPVLFVGAAFAEDDLPQNLGTANLGQTVLIPIRLQAPESGSITVSGTDVLLSFDPSVFTFDGVSAGAVADGSLGGGAFVIQAVEDTPGNIHISGDAAVGALLPAGQTATVYLVQFTVKQNAAVGTTNLNLRVDDEDLATALFDGSGASLLFLPPPLDTPGDDTDGVLTIQAAPTPPPSPTPLPVVIPPVLPPVSLIEVLVSFAGRSRSNVRSVTLRFNGPVQIPGNIAQLLGLLGRGTRKIRISVDPSLSTSEQTVLVLTFTGPTTVRLGGGRALPPSRYLLTLLGTSLIDQSGRPVDVDGDGAPGGFRILNLVQKQTRRRGENLVRLL